MCLFTRARTASLLQTCTMFSDGDLTQVIVWHRYSFYLFILLLRLWAPAGAKLSVPSASVMVVLGQTGEKACSFLYLCRSLTRLH